MLINLDNIIELMAKDLSNRKQYTKRRDAYVPGSCLKVVAKGKSAKIAPNLVRHLCMGILGNLTSVSAGSIRETYRQHQVSQVQPQ